MIYTSGEQIRRFKWVLNMEKSICEERLSQFSESEKNAMPYTKGYRDGSIAAIEKLIEEFDDIFADEIFRANKEVAC